MTLCDSNDDKKKLVHLSVNWQYHLLKQYPKVIEWTKH